MAVKPPRDLGKPVLPDYIEELQKLTKNPKTIGILEFLTGVAAAAIDKPANLILSGGRLTQALLKGEFYEQLYSEVHKYRSEGKISNEKLDSNYGRTIFVELMRTIDEENLDEEKFKALKSIFLNSVRKDNDEHAQLLAYQYFLVCKKLSSLDILILRVAFDIYEEPGGNQPSGGITEWETRIAEKLGIPRELISQSRIENSPVSQTPKTVIFDAENTENKHGLTVLGTEIGEFLKGI